MTSMIKTELVQLDAAPPKQCLKQTCVPWLWLLCLLFALRVIAQILLAQFDIPLLPLFER